uniref:ERCC4 domain-containing protein n=1 Tax=viral metagenome TaxID=1070528 RepID=A0A6C0E5S5_9ZZZZ
MSFIIDNREKDLKSIFTTEAIYENLDLGDILFKYQNKPFILIERKKIPDLIASIDDGRYRNQKKRLLECGIPRNRILYILEGNIDQSPGKMKTIFGMIINTLYRDGIPVLFFSNMEETIYFLRRIHEKIENKDPAILTSFLNDNINDKNDNVNVTCDNNTQEYLSTIKMKKKDNLTPLNCSILQLAQIPGVSVSIATLIIKQYNSISNLVINYMNKDKEEKEKELMLSNLEVNTSTGKKRKLGPIISKRVYQYLTNQDSQESISSSSDSSS